MNYTKHAIDLFDRASSLFAKDKDLEVTEELKRSVMASCDIRSILESWGVHPQMIGSREWRGYCPDHFLHDGHRQHRPSWSMDMETGDSICFSSSKASNFIYIAKRMYGLETIRETVEQLVNGGCLVLPAPDFVVDDNVVARAEEEEKKRIENLRKGISMVEGLIRSGARPSRRCLEYFAADGICEGTVEALGIRSVDRGYLEGRAVIPFIGKDGRVCGYVAVNFRGKDWWVDRTYSKMSRMDASITRETVENSYRKVLYCPGFQSRRHLYGLYEVLSGGKGIDELVVVEGERDAIKLLQEGIACVSVHGTKVKDEQATMIKRINPKVLYLGFDMDNAGNEATEKAYRRLCGEVEDIYVLSFPGGKDPKKFGGAEIRSLMEFAKSNRVRTRVFEK